MSEVNANMYSSWEVVRLPLEHHTSPLPLAPLPSLPHSLTHIHSLSSSLPLLCSEAASASERARESHKLSEKSLLLHCFHMSHHLRGEKRRRKLWDHHVWTLSLFESAFLNSQWPLEIRENLDDFRTPHSPEANTSRSQPHPSLSLPRLDLGSERAVGGCQQAPGPCAWAGVALEWVQGNWSAGPGGSAGPEGEEAGSGSGFGSGYGGAEWAEGGAMLSAIWETEGLQTVGIVVLVFASIKLLHLLGLISFSEGKTLMETEGEKDRNGEFTANKTIACW